MTVVSSKEFAANQEKYFDLALDEQVFVKRGENIFLLISKNVNDMNIYHEASVYEEVLEPDDDLRTAISADEFKKRALEIVEKVHNMYYLDK